MAIPDKVILSILNPLFAESVLLRLPILIVLLSYGILFVHLSPLVVSLVSNLLSSLFIKLCSPLVNTYEEEIISQNWDLFLISPQNGNSEIFPVRHLLPFIQKKKQKEPVFVLQNQQRRTFIKFNKNGNG